LEEVDLELKTRGDLEGGFVALLNLLSMAFLAHLAFEEGALIFEIPNASQKVPTPFLDWAFTDPF